MSVEAWDALIRQRWGGPIEEVRKNLAEDMMAIAEDMGIDWGADD